MRRFLSRLTWPNRLMLATAALLLAWLLQELVVYRLLPWLAPCYQTERFDLSAAPAAAEGYPMEVEEGRFIASDGSSFPISGGFLEGDGGLSYIGDGKSAAPDSMEVRWFSYPEDKFYEGHFLLPQRRIYDLLLWMRATAASGK